MKLREKCPECHGAGRNLNFPHLPFDVSCDYCEGYGLLNQYLLPFPDFYKWVKKEKVEWLGPR